MLLQNTNPKGISKDNVTLANYCKGIFIPVMSIHGCCLITLRVDLEHVSNVFSLFSTFIPKILEKWTVDFSKIRVSSEAFSNSNIGNKTTNKNRKQKSKAGNL